MPLQEQRKLKLHQDGYAMRLHLANVLEWLNHEKQDLIWQEIGVGPQAETGRVRAHPQDWGHAMIKRRDIATSYHLAVVVDDALQGISHIVRGQDLFYATSLHILLQRLLKLPSPIYCHHPLIKDETGRKLSKSNKDIAIHHLRAEGWSAQQIIKEINLPDFYSFSYFN